MMHGVCVHTLMCGVCVHTLWIVGINSSDAWSACTHLNAWSVCTHLVACRYHWQWCTECVYTACGLLYGQVSLAVEILCTLCTCSCFLCNAAMSLPWCVNFLCSVLVVLIVLVVLPCLSWLSWLSCLGCLICLDCPGCLGCRAVSECGRCWRPVRLTKTSRASFRWRLQAHRDQVLSLWCFCCCWKRHRACSFVNSI